MRLIDADEMAKNESEAYISAQAKITSPVTLGLNSVVHRKMQQLIADAPTIAPESLRPQGRWIRGALQNGERLSKCSACGERCRVPTCVGKPIYDYCPNCGAKMKGAETDA